MTTAATAHADGRSRCDWGGAWEDPGVGANHDEEWGVPVRDERRLFEMLSLGRAQAGLSWSSILRKRDGYRRVFVGFDSGSAVGHVGEICGYVRADLAERCSEGTVGRRR